MTDRQKASLLSEARRQAQFYDGRDPEVAQFWENIQLELTTKGKESFTLILLSGVNNANNFLIL